ncbi:hypothetical protein HZB60_04235 [candidate division KSB1 bacterium]|nr:hypothetical protein [candidate division KSB1 bacterium]
MGAVHRSRKLRLLRELDDSDPGAQAIIVTVTNDQDDVTRTRPMGGRKKIASVSDDYLEFAMMSNPDIELYMETGELRSGYLHARNRDYELLEQFNASSISKNRNKIWLDTKNPTPAQVIASAEPYVLGLLELGKKFHPRNAGELQVGYDIDRITSA